MKTEHTPTPYSLSGIPNDNHLMAKARKGGRKTVAIFVRSPETSVEEFHATKEFIVLACNHRAQLVSALNDELEAIQVWIRAAGIPDDVFDGLEISRDKIRCILSQIEKESSCK